NTGSPAAPSARYNANAAKPRRLPRTSPTSSTPKFCNVNGTGVTGRGTVILAHNATNKLAPTTSTTCRAQYVERSCAGLKTVSIFAMIVFLLREEAAELWFRCGPCDGQYRRNRDPRPASKLACAAAPGHTARWPRTRSPGY